MFSVAFLGVLLCLALSGYADTIHFDDSHEKYNLDYYMEFLEDRNHTYTINDVSSSKANYLFVSSSTSNLNFGLTKSSYWFRFTVSNASKRNQNFSIEIRNPFLDYITVYQPSAAGWTFSEGGDYHPFSDRKIKNRYHIFSVHIPKKTTQTFYMNINSRHGVMDIPASFWVAEKLKTHHHDLQFMFGISYGIILIIIINNLFVFWSIRSYSNLYYVIAMISSLLLVVALNGHGYEYIWKDNVWIQNNIVPVIIVSVSFWTTLFCRAFLETKLHLPNMDKVLIVLLIIQGFATFFTLFVPYSYAVITSVLVSILTLIFLLITGGISMKREVPLASFFMLAFSIYLLGLLVYYLNSWAIIKISDTAQYSVQVGAILQVILISFAASKKVKVLQKERSNARKKALELQQEVTEQLEQKVAIRTRQIEEQTQEIEMAYQNLEVLARIGQEITSSLNFEEIFYRLYDYVNTVMDASRFRVNIYYPERAQVEYKFSIEHEKILTVETVSMQDENNLSVWTIKNQKEIFMNNVRAEYEKYVSNLEFVSAKWANSVIYIPLIISDRVLGCVTVQSFHKNAYDVQDLDVMKTLASYAAIALDHAEAYDTLRTANNNTMQSIRYAKRIQEAILPPHDQLSSNFNELFMFYKPRDIVSGDFYWFSELDECKFIASVDCTGHGVPGAFMTMMGNDLLNHVINEMKIMEPSEILHELDHKVQKTLQSRNDGMDMTLVKVDQKHQKVVFAGAKSPLFCVQKQRSFILRGSKFPIGSNQFRLKKVFTAHEVAYQEGDIFYMYTDGFQDQFGGKTGQKYLSKRFRQFLLQISVYPLEEQYHKLKQELHSWQGTNKQTDDILVIGFKI